jgi:hypothetical protein
MKTIFGWVQDLKKLFSEQVKLVDNGQVEKGRGVTDHGHRLHHLPGLRRHNGEEYRACQA